MAEVVDPTLKGLLSDAYELAAESTSFIEGDVDTVGQKYSWNCDGVRSALEFNAGLLMVDEIEALPEAAR